MANIRYSWIIPIHNESQSLPGLFEEIKRINLKNYEIIAINDGSTDNTGFVLKKLSKKTPALKIIHLKSRQGKWPCLEIGFRAARGQIIVTSDSDLQDDPEEVNKLLSRLDAGYDLVSGWRFKRHDRLYKVWISKIGNNLASALTGHQFKDLNSPFKVYKRELIDRLPLHGSLIRFSMLFADKLGYKVAEVPINHRPRLYGQSKFGIVKYLRIIYDLILIFLLFSGSSRLKKQ